MQHLRNQSIWGAKNISFVLQLLPCSVSSFYFGSRTIPAELRHFRINKYFLCIVVVLQHLIISGSIRAYCANRRIFVTQIGENTIDKHSLILENQFLLPALNTCSDLPIRPCSSAWVDAAGWSIQHAATASSKRRSYDLNPKEHTPC